MKFNVYQKNNNSKDIVMKLEAADLKMAISHASQIKKLNINLFLELFEVEENKK